MFPRTPGTFNPDKMKEVILFLLEQHGPMTPEELCTMLYFCDFDHYEKYETSITGATYHKTP